MTYNYDELFARYTATCRNPSVSHLIDLLEGDFEQWEMDGGADEPTALMGDYTHDEAVWMYEQLTQATSA